MATISGARYLASGAVEFHFPFDPHLYELLKKVIAPRARDFDRDYRIWTVVPPYADIAVGLLLERYPDARVEGPGSSSGEDADEIARLCAVFHLLPTAPPELFEAAYHILGLLAGGDPDVMRRLNEAREALRKRGRF